MLLALHLISEKPFPFLGVPSSFVTEEKLSELHPFLTSPAVCTLSLQEVEV